MVNKANQPRATAKAKMPHLLQARLYNVVRLTHLYTSMVSLLVVLFFSVTGVALNHPEWAFVNTQRQQTYQGTLPPGWRSGGAVDWLTTAETLRARYGLKGSVGDTRADAQEASLSFRAPAYAADVFIKVSDGSYSLRVVTQGPLAVMNDLHRGRDAGPAWAWVIDLSGGFLALLALTGLALSLFLRKTRRAALVTALGGALLAGWMMRLAGG